MKGYLQRANCAQHDSGGDTNHHQQQLQEVDKNYRMLFSKGVPEIECAATTLKIETWSILGGSEAATPGAVSLVKGDHHPGMMNSPENRFCSICQMKKWNSSISEKWQLLSYSEYFLPNKMIFFLTSWVWGLYWLLLGEKSLICTLVAFTLGALSLGGLW